MTAVIHHGPPGSYKTFSLLQNVIVPALLQGREVVTNIRGLDDIDQVETALNAMQSRRFGRRPKPLMIPDTARIINVPHDLKGFELMARFFHWAPKGALIVMDEGQKVYPTRLKTLSGFDFPGGELAAEQADRPATVEDAFDRHRHHNWDVYISTPFIDKIHKEVRTVCEYAFAHRDMHGFLPGWKHRYKVTKHNPINNGQSQSHAIGQVNIEKADVRLFACYGSTATGVAKLSSESKSIFQNKKLYFYFGVIALAILGFASSANQIYEREKARDSAKDQGQFVQSDRPVGSVAGDPVAVQSPDAPRGVLDALIADRHIKYLGSITMADRTEAYFQIRSEDGAFTHVGLLHLQALGIEARIQGCIAVLSSGPTQHVVTCESAPPPPQADPGAAMQAGGMTAAGPWGYSAPEQLTFAPESRSRGIIMDHPQPEAPTMDRGRPEGIF